MPPGHILPCPEGCGAVVILKDVVSGPFNYVEQNGYLKIYLMCLGKWGPRERGWLPSNHFPPLKRTLALSISNRMSCFILNISNNNNIYIKYLIIKELNN